MQPYGPYLRLIHPVLAAILIHPAAQNGST